ncbi:tubulin-like doman-containing protein [Lamprobacter modestohalophilus]|uniref:tubulin-like doman-containing protein n=1 Tax=Lamprobacter modestohalophilus TaxID=1064514 RepID=UPI002ADEBB3A|nr:tubulin-like doman-containing protein [Lamprobacter modestohalophilus]MEA1049461.1 tubulin-like doman-containing protein [Lamprobacter modestohalophilus]
MSQNNLLLIGLGGTGCAVVRELKKKLYIEWRAKGNSGPYPAVYRFEDDFGGERVESRIATLSVDSNAKDLEGQGEKDRKWKVFGETLRLQDTEKVLLNPTGIDRILSSLDRYPGIQPWIQDELDFVRDITRGTTEPAGCNQIRRMGRLALANGNSLANVISAVAGRLSELSRDGEAGAEIHVVCTLGCGTGSGTLVDLVVQVQKYLADNAVADKYTLYLHGFATASDVGGVNTGNFFANQYGALLELNSIRLSIYSPWDIGAKASPTRLDIRSPQDEQKGHGGTLKDTFKSVALCTEITEGGRLISLDQQIENVAEFLFQIGVRQMGNLPKPLRDALTVEDRRQYPADAPGGGRSTAFIGYGVERVAIPEREIREKLAYSFARQFLLRLLFANWDNGYRELAREFSRDGWVGERRAPWTVTHEDLLLDQVVDTTGEPEYESYQRDWDGTLQRMEAQVKEQLGEAFEARKGWIEDFERRARKYWEAGFRKRGAPDYFKIRRETVELQNRARSVRARIEEDLIRNLERVNPDYPLHQLPDAIDYLINKVLEPERIGFGEAESQAAAQVEQAEQQRKEIREQFDKCGRLLVGGKPERLFSEYRAATVRFYYWRTQQLAAAYAQLFCSPLIDELKGLHKELTTFDTRLKQVAEFCETEGAARVRDDGGSTKDGDTTYLVDARAVSEIIRKRFEADKPTQDLRAQEIMDGLKRLRGDRLELAAYNERLPVDGDGRVGGLWVDDLRRLAEQVALEAHRKLEQDDPRFEGLLGTNIVRKLFRDYGGHVDGSLEQWLRDLIDKAMPMLAFDPNEEPMDLPTDGPVLRRFVFVPACNAGEAEGDLEGFQQHLRERLGQITGAKGGCKEVTTYPIEVPEERNPAEITILTVAFFFPARYTKVAHALKQKYAQRLDQRSETESRRGYFEVHTESHRPPLPDLMKLDRKEVLKEQFAPVLLATVLDLMQVPETAGKPILFGTVDEFGRVEDKVETGMTADAKLHELSDGSKERFGHSIPLPVMILYYRYLEQFKEESLGPVQALLERKVTDALDLTALDGRLKQMSGQSFLLAGRKEDDATYRLFDAKLGEAAELARRLAARVPL